MEDAKKLSIALCQKILNQGSEKYTEEQVRIIRDVLYDLAELDYLILKQTQFTELPSKPGSFEPDFNKAA